MISMRSLQKLNIGKSAGSNCLLNDFFKYGSCCYTFINVLSCLFKKMFDLRYFPTDWTEVLTVPLHKKGDIDEPSNYKGITLLSTFC